MLSRRLSLSAHLAFDSPKRWIAIALWVILLVAIGAAVLIAVAEPSWAGELHSPRSGFANSRKRVPERHIIDANGNPVEASACGYDIRKSAADSFIRAIAGGAWPPCRIDRWD
jgi:hypothetical protein